MKKDKGKKLLPVDQYLIYKEFSNKSSARIIVFGLQRLNWMDLAWINDMTRK